LPRFIIGELDRLGTHATADLLAPWVADPNLGDEAGTAIRRLRRTNERRSSQVARGAAGITEHEATRLASADHERPRPRG
jgi:hypothetical protein